jgi:glycosyltransferase involved in cell wall biosynthesis
MKKILVIHTSYKNFGGEDVAVASELKLLKKYYEVDTLTFKNSAENYLKLFFQFLTSNNKKSNKILQKKIDIFKPDIVYVHNTWFKANLGIFDVLKRNNLLILLKIHNFRFDCTRHYSFKKHLSGKNYCQGCGLDNSKFKVFNKYFEDSYLKSLFVIIYGKKYFKIIKNSNIRIACLTEFQKKYLINLGVKANRLFVHRNFIEGSSNELHEYDPKSEYISYAGRISKEKGIYELIANFLRLKNHNLKLMLIGDGPELKKIINKFKKEDSIIFTGQIDNKQSRELIFRSKAVITATRLYEGQPTLLTEASIMGVPSIFSNNGGISEFYPENYKLMYTCLSDKDLLKKLNYLNDSELLMSIGKENQLFIQKLLNENNYIQNFSEILNHE